MNFEFYLENEKAKKVPPNRIRAESLFQSALQAVKTAKEIPLSTTSAKTIFRELYERLREYCEAIGYLNGYKFLDHESIGLFIRDMLGESTLAKKFDRYRKLRNGINYYGEDLEIETIEEAIIEVPEIIGKLEKHSKKSSV